jgi:protein-S-isoprenylcysteine O-methyltransferase Ste14
METLIRFLSKDTPESSRRLIAFISAAVLAICALLLCEALVFPALADYQVSPIVAGSFALVAGYVAWLARALFVAPTSPGPDPEVKQ